MKEKKGGRQGGREIGREGGKENKMLSRVCRKYIVSAPRRLHRLKL